jgi:ABC-type glycerol-3-phosphate transport system substrate-binding protein
MRRFATSAASAMALISAASVAWAQDCPADAAGSIRILSNDFIAIHAVIDAAKECASDTLEITSNATTEHDSIAMPSLTGSPAEYSVAIIANGSVLPLVNEGLVRPLDELVAEYGQHLDPTQLIKVNGQIIAIAFMANAQHLIYRPDVLEQAGVEPPTSYEEVLEAAEAIKTAGLMDTPFAANVKPGWDLGEEFVNMYLGYGGEFFADGTANYDIDPVKGAQALEMLKSLAAYMPPDFQTFDSNTVSALYHEGRVGLINMWGSRAGSYLGPNSLPEVAENTAFAAAPTVGGGTIPATTIWWDGFVIAQNISDEEAEASFRVMMHAIDTPTATNNPDAAAWLIPGFEPGPASAGVIASAEAGAKPYPMIPQMGILHEALGAELADFMAGRETAEQALADVQGSYEAAARTQGFLQ